MTRKYEWEYKWEYEWEYKWEYKWEYEWEYEWEYGKREEEKFVSSIYMPFISVGILAQTNHTLVY